MNRQSTGSRKKRSFFFSLFDKRPYLREVSEDILKLLFHHEEEGRRPRLTRMASEIGCSQKILAAAIEHLRNYADIDSNLVLTQKGRQRALVLIRRHRLYETYLAEHSSFAPQEWHSKAERVEHAMDEAEEERISRLLGNPRFDPHGDPIPTKDGHMPIAKGQSLAGKMQIPGYARILHMEDEPEDAFLKLVKIGLYPGAILQLLEETQDGLQILFEGKKYLLSPVMRSQITVSTSLDVSIISEELNCIRLHQLPSGTRALVVGISDLYRGAGRRRLLDLGFVPGSIVSIDLRSPLGNPTAYLVRGSTIALRHDQAAHIRVRPISANKNPL